MDKIDFDVPLTKEKGPLDGILGYYGMILPREDCKNISGTATAVMAIIITMIESRSVGEEKEKFFNEFFRISKDNGISIIGIRKALKKSLARNKKQQKPDPNVIELLSDSLAIAKKL